MNSFKEHALDTYVKNIKDKLPAITEHELEVVKHAFNTGFNIGYADDKSETVQKVALQLLSK